MAPYLRSLGITLFDVWVAAVFPIISFLALVVVLIYYHHVRHAGNEDEDGCSETVVVHVCMHGSRDDYGTFVCRGYERMV
jgi:uncharacterized membrane protein